MTRITVIGTIHEDVGQANASELLAILLHFRPEVIFLEMPPSAAEDHLNGARSNLESTAVNRYREVHQVALVPVDLPTPDSEFFYNYEELHDSIRIKSSDYCKYLSWDRQYVEMHGFPYLNGSHYGTILSSVHEARLAVLEELADPRLAEIYEEWLRTNERRDVAMVEGIVAYCRDNPFNTGVFLVGAAHRQSLQRLSAAHAGTGAVPIQWDFFGLGLSCMIDDTGR